MAEKLKRIKALRQVEILKINNLLKAAENASANADERDLFKAMYSSAEDIKCEFSKQHTALINIVFNEEDEFADALSVMSTFDKTFFQIKLIFEQLFAVKNMKTEDVTDSPSHVSLPKLQLIKFKGDISSFPTFLDMYNSIVHKNPKLTPVEKFSYLLSSLEGPPLKVVKCLPLRGSNYEIAYNALVKRYKNNRLISQAHWTAIEEAPMLTSENSHDLRNLIDTFSENLDALRELQHPVEHWDFILTHMLLNKIPQETVTRFGLLHSSTADTMPKYKDLYTFLDNQCNALNTLKRSNKIKPKSSNSVKGAQSPVRHSTSSKSFVSTNNPSYKCLLCKDNHALYQCPDFKSKSPSERFQFVKQNNLCVNCFSHMHKTIDCKSTHSCRTCTKRHHSLLHFDRPVESSVLPTNQNSPLLSPSTSELGSAPQPELVTQTLANFTCTPTEVLLSTALVEVRDIRGHYQTIRAIIDTGSQTSLITQKCSNRLGLPKNKVYSEIQGIGEMGINSQLGCVSLSVRPINGNNLDLVVNAIILPRICSDLPNATLAKENWNYIRNLKLADPEFHKPGPIDLLLGADLFPLIIQSGRVLGKNNEPTAINTIFGYILMGKFKNNQFQSNIQTLLCKTEQPSLNAILSKFWELESIPKRFVLSPDDELCEKKYIESTIRDSAGRFVVALPFRYNEPNFPNSRNLALNNFLSLERRLLKNPILYQEYSDFLREYLDLNHMEVIKENINTDKSFYIPHHCIIKPDSLSTRLRVVFNASFKISNGSLNDSLLVGPKLQKDIVQILLHFRLHQVVLTADICKMYRQILITPDHQNYQRILWRFNPSDPVMDFRLRTVTYGVSCAPYLALRTILQLAEEEKNRFPRAADVLRNDTYVDDIVTGCPSVEDAISLQKELSNLLKSGGFELHKWATNKPEVLSHLSQSLINPASLSLDNDETTKILGLRWQPASDSFSYKITPIEKSCSKRHMLSELARIFDPLGFLTPVTFSIKYLIQKLWIQGLNWDDEPPADIVRVWNRYKCELSLLSEFHLPRYIALNETNDYTVELHAFADASDRGYASVIYLRACYNNTYSTYLVCSKSRVAPLKTISIPRLELCAAVLLSELTDFVLKTYANKISFTKIYAYTDSTIALAWIKSHPHRWKPFVSNRVSYIQERTNPQDWYHIGSCQNPADIASRGAFPSELLSNSLWWAGPDFLQKSENCWTNIHTNVADSSEINSELKKNITLAASQVNDNFLDVLLNNHSSLNRLTRIVSCILRFLNNCRYPNTKLKGSFSLKEHHSALLALTKREQEIAFQEEINKILTHKKLPKPFQKLNIFIDPSGILRVGGRLHHSGILYDKKHPALLPRESRLTYLLIENIHLKYFHAGHHAVQFLLVQNFWVLSAKRAIRHVLSKCIKCFKTNPQPFQPLMGALPNPRVSPNKPFSHSGVDYAGPFNITLSKSRGSKTYKAYVCLFICLSIKAIHIELVCDLTADSFLAALRRFIARRGRVSHLYSDNGTCFVKANKELLNFTRLAASTERLVWHFIPPSAPHFGGLWEAGVKSVKSHLVKVMGDQVLTYEEFYTILCQTEAILNSRPLTPLSSDPNDLSVLTPGHFLTLEPLTTVPDSDLTHIKLNRLNRWQLLQRIHQDLWKRWHREYLHTLQQRSKWLKHSVSPEIGTLVLIKDDCLPPLKWRLGRISTLYPGTDGTVRVADVNTVNGVLKRPLIKLCPLPVSAFENA